MSKLSKVIDRIQKVIANTGAKITLEWGDGTKVFISRHVYAVRRPEVPKMEPVDDAALYTFDEMTEMTPEDWATLKIMGRQGGKFKMDKAEYQRFRDALDNHDKIQGDDQAPWMKKDDSSG
jgi:hypothetical protein